MAKRMLLMLALTVIVVAGLGFTKYHQIEAATHMIMQPPPEAVTTIVTKQEKWPATLNVIGTVAAVQGVTVSADLPGTVDRIAFRVWQIGQCRGRSGRARYASGTRSVGCGRGAARSCSHQFRPNSGTRKGGRHGAKMEYDNMTAQKNATEAQVGEIRATIARKTIRRAVLGRPGYPPDQPRTIPVGW